MELKKDNNFERNIATLKQDTLQLVEMLRNPVDVEDARKKINRHLREVDEERKTYTRQVDNFKKEIMNKYKEALEPAEELKKEFDKELEKIKEEKIKSIENLKDYDEYIKYHEFDKKWLNKSYTLEQIQNEISGKVLNQTLVTKPITIKGTEDSIKRIMKRLEKDKVEIL